MAKLEKKKGRSFSTGDVVQLNSGGPSMTVNSYIETPQEVETGIIEGDQEVELTYFDDAGTQQTKRFKEKTLKKV
ncbi:MULTISPECIES: YodC family protein [Flammeovirga]|uniref:DUF2158 domain-containing protein n=1 Tax=Flammeovirga agarivorans TaxID=2726742 RepID=A0A7X8SKX9_9BACT|nr:MULTISPECIES: DUF2158 domain-containing protein [Flammeovirga]NLR92128.1 DUF2158 domain-containing protein [Flammeovirga agarivorans]